jgi:hypothetical protein
MFFLFLSTGPVNTLILETAPVNLRASAMAVSIFTIHLILPSKPSGFFDNIKLGEEVR